MDKIQTPFRSLDKKDQQAFSKLFGKSFTGLQFNKYYAKYTYMLNNWHRAKAEFEARDFYDKTSLYNRLVDLVVRHIEPNFYYFTADTAEALREMQKPALDKIAYIFDMFKIVDKRNEKAAMKREIQAEAEDMLDLEGVKRELWMFNFASYNKTNIAIQAPARIDAEKKSAIGHYRGGYVLMPISKTGYYKLEEVKTYASKALQNQINWFSNRLKNLTACADLLKTEE